MAQVNEILDHLQAMLEPTQRANADATLSWDDQPYLDNVPQIECADGFSMSVQASKFHYCTPRDSAGPWTKVEVGFPSERVESLMPYIDGGKDTDPTGTVYGYVPIEIVAQVIADHGGFASETFAA